MLTLKFNNQFFLAIFVQCGMCYTIVATETNYRMSRNGCWSLQ